MGNKLKKYPEFIILTLFTILIISCYIFKIDICIFKYIFGIPCPSCGMTRAYLSLLRLDIHKAFFYHPLFIIIPIILIVIIISKYKNISLSKLRMFWYLTGITFILVWIIRMFMYFPNVEPMKYTKKSYLYIIINIIKNLI
jgi:hypothetical protein